MSDVNQNDKTGDEEPTATEAEKNRELLRRSVARGMKDAAGKPPKDQV
jgi:hypothetical protein